ncbi:MAG: hypothetical protein MJ116_02580 [Lachnospiraceae bacterium]|nr:hypothetical protein [Lachnospiraceae bacterium]
MIRTDTDSMQKGVHDLLRLSEQMRRVSDDVRRSERGLTRCSTVVQRASGSLHSFERSLDQFSDNIDRNARILNQIAERYEQAERQCMRMDFKDGKKNSSSDQQSGNLADFIGVSKIKIVPMVEPGGIPKPIKIPTFIDAFTERYTITDILKSFGNVGKIFGVVDSVMKATSWNQWTKAGWSAYQTISKIATDYNHYMKIGRAVSTKQAVSWFLKKQVGLRKVGRASTISTSPMARFYNNLHMKTSPFNLSDAFAPLTGAKGVKTTVAAWAGVAMTGVTNAIDNVKEQKNSNGTITTGRVIAETITETAIDTVVTYGGSAVVGAAIATVTGAVAAPVVVAIATGAGIAAINAGVESWTGKSATEWTSDFILDSAINVGKGIKNGAKTVGNWFNKMAIAW